MVGLNYDGTEKSYVNLQECTSCTSSISVEQQIIENKERAKELFCELLKTSWYQIFKRNSIINSIKFCRNHGKEIEILIQKNENRNFDSESRRV